MKKMPKLFAINPNVPPRDMRHGCRAPFYFEVCRWVVLYRLLGFGVADISTVSGVSARNVKYILEIFGGDMPRRSNGFGSIIWSGKYSITREIHRRLGLPSSVPSSVDHDNGGLETFEGDNIHLAKLPPLEWKPEDDGWSNWTFDDWLTEETRSVRPVVGNA